MTWIGIQRLGYVEFDMAGRMLFGGSFRHLLNSQIKLRNLESSLDCAKTPDECWCILKTAYKEFGFHEIRIQIAGRFYEEIAKESGTVRAWHLTIPLSMSDYVQLIRPFGQVVQHNVVAPLADVLLRTLEPKLSTPPFSQFATPVIPPRAEASPQRMQIASTGD